MAQSTHMIQSIELISLQKLEEVGIRPVVDRDIPFPRRGYDLFLENRCVGGLNIEGSCAVVKIIVWPGGKSSPMVAVYLYSEEDAASLPSALRIRLSAFAAMERPAEAGPEAGAGVESGAAERSTRTAWVWDSIVDGVSSSKSGQHGSSAHDFECAKCGRRTPHVRSGERTVLGGRAWYQWQCTSCGLRHPLPS